MTGPRTEHAAAVAASSPHEPHRPGWTCRACNGATPWPCDTARVSLAEEYGPNRTGLATYMGGQLASAVAELTTTPPAELFERFISWTRYGAHPAPAVQPTPAARTASSE